MCQRQGITFLFPEQAKPVIVMVFSEAAADIINAYATDMGLLTPENKLNRWWKAGRTKTNAKQIEEIGSKPITGFYLMVRRIQLSPKCKRETSPIQSH